MNFKSVVAAVTSKTSRQLLKAQKHSPTILFAAGVVGVVATAVLASRATLRLDEILGEVEEKLEQRDVALEHDDYSTDDYKRDGVVIYTQAALKLAKLYGPAVIIGIASVAALTGSHYILKQRNLGLMAAYVGLDKAFKNYRDRVVGELGEEKDREFRRCLADVDEDVDGVVQTTKVSSLAKKDAPYMILFDESNVNWSPEPNVNVVFLSAIQNFANDKLRAQGHLFLNELLDMLGMEHTSAGAVTGWIMNQGDSYVDLGIFEGSREMGMRFIQGVEKSVWLDPNVHGVIWDLI